MLNLRNNRAFLGALVLAGVLMLPTLAPAELSPYTGHVDYATGQINGTMNFTVLGPGDALSQLLADSANAGVGAGTFELGPADYLYLFQVVNDSASGPDSAVISSFAQNLAGPGAAAPFNVSWWGSFSGLAFTDGGVGIGPSMGGSSSDGAGGDLDGPANAETFGLGNSNDLISPMAVRFDPGMFGSLVVDYYGDGVGPGLGYEQVSEIVGFVSPIAPSYWAGSLVDGGGTSFGSKRPAVTPAPDAALLALLGLGLLFGLGWMRRRQTVSAE